MKNKSSAWNIAISVSVSFLLMLLVLSVQQAYSASCFTDTGGHWAESFICWMKTTGLSSGYPDGTFRPNNSITRAEVASLLYKEASGNTYANMGPSAWQVNGVSAANAYILYFTNEAQLSSNATGSNLYQVSVPLIASLHNQQMTVKGAKLCYAANATAGGSISTVGVSLEDGSGSLVDSVTEHTTRTDATCRTYSFTTPDGLVGTDSLVLYVETNLVATTDYVYAFGATAIQGFSPTAGLLAPSPSFPGPVPGVAP